MTDAFVGKYECHAYDAGGKNDWHYLEVTSNGDGAYKWTNRAGASWTLTPGKDPSKLALKDDCPYFKDVKFVEVRRNSSGAVTALVMQGEAVSQHAFGRLRVCSSAGYCFFWGVLACVMHCTASAQVIPIRAQRANVCVAQTILLDAFIYFECVLYLDPDPPPFYACS